MAIKSVAKPKLERNPLREASPVDDEVIKVTSLTGQVSAAAERVSPSTGREMHEALVSGIRAAQEANLKVDHGFRVVTALDNKPAVEITITRNNSTEVTLNLCEGARGKLCDELAPYGARELKGAGLLPHADFEAMVARLFKAIENFHDVDGVLQTDDAALKRVYELVQEGVRTDNGVSWVVFGTRKMEGGSVVSSYKVHGNNPAFSWYANCAHNFCALFA
jgi:hypothetical protein